MYAIPGQTPAAAAAAPEPQATAPAARSVAQVLAESNVLAVLDELDRDLVGPLLGAQRRCLLRLETLDTFLRAPEPIDRPLQPCLGCTS